MKFLINRWFSFNFGISSIRLRLWDEWMIKSAIQRWGMLFTFTHTYCCWIVLTVALMPVDIILPSDLIRVWLNLSNSIRPVLLLTCHCSKSMHWLSLDMLNCSLFQLLLVLLLWPPVQEFSELTLCKLVLLIKIGLLAFYKIVHLICLHWMKLVLFKRLALKRVLL